MSDALEKQERRTIVSDLKRIVEISGKCLPKGNSVITCDMFITVSL